MRVLEKKIKAKTTQPAAKAVGLPVFSFLVAGGQPCVLRCPTLIAFTALALPLGLSFSSGKNPIERLDGGGSGGVTLSANSRSVSNTWRN